MSPDELFALLVSSILSVRGAIAWYRPALTMRARACSSTVRALQLIVPPVCAGLLLLVLTTLAASDVVTSPMYIGFYLLMGIAFVSTAASGLPLMGLVARRDALERGNLASAIAVVGAIIGLTFCFAGGNIGDGPGWWVVVVCALLATAAWYSLWLVLQLLTNVAEHVSIDRDVATGLRLGGFLIATGLILGRAVAGDWESAEATFADFTRMAWPAIGLMVLAVLVELLSRPTPHMPRPPVSLCGVVPATVYLAMAAGWLTLVGTGR